MADEHFNPPVRNAIDVFSWQSGTESRWERIPSRSRYFIPKPVKRVDITINQSLFNPEIQPHVVNRHLLPGQPGVCDRGLDKAGVCFVAKYIGRSEIIPGEVLEVAHIIIPGLAV